MIQSRFLLQLTLIASCLITGTVSTVSLSWSKKLLLGNSPVSDSIEESSPLLIASSSSVPTLKLGEHEDLEEKSRLLQEVSASPSEDHHDEEEEHHDDEKRKPWGEVIGASLLVNLATLSGVIFFCTFARQEGDIKSNNRSKNWKDIIIPAFAAGALIATAVFLTLPESIGQMQTSLMEEEEEEHHEEENGEHHEEEDHGFEILPSVSWRFGAALLGGFLLPIAFSTFFPHAHTDNIGNDDSDQLGEGWIDEEKQTKKGKDLRTVIACRASVYIIKILILASLPLLHFHR